ncbi:predicted protein [Sclerotinia sclerotiorum 1980 UF-70]|uniref:Uncharacterized protein n=1 Tax=Sclerotinia sclerotiorum (strain ATCC 18683 / 1980 / Ss-1) TaxID=665079 RepID=A7K6N2_SCLS1|nr:predicted protein [Sclerotinia sclerotiorum 1980 UF-70]EDO00632.1 predicted protein [Sclerotinia sclerotiorum 1980 UF-70]
MKKDLNNNLRPPLDLLDPESLWTFDSYGPTIRMDLRFVWTYDSYGPTIRMDLRFVWTYDSYP